MRMMKIYSQWKKPIRVIPIRRKFYRFPKIGWKKSEMRVCLTEKIKYISMKILTLSKMSNISSSSIWKPMKTIWVPIGISLRICKRTNNLIKSMKKIEGNKKGARSRIKKISLRVSLCHKNRKDTKEVKLRN